MPISPINDDDAERKRKVLRDGEALHVPTMLRDAAPGFDASLHRPGYRVADQAAQDARDRAYADYCRRQESAWKSPQQAVADTERAAEPPLCEDAREDAYQRYKNWLVNAWRGAR
jgi:hypothetical protein